VRVLRGTVPLAADASAAGHVVETRTPLLPLTLGGKRLPLRAAPPALGQDTEPLLRELGYAPAQVEQFRQDRVIGL